MSSVEVVFHNIDPLVGSTQLLPTNENGVSTPFCVHHSNKTGTTTPTSNRQQHSYMYGWTAEWHRRRQLMITSAYRIQLLPTAHCDPACLSATTATRYYTTAPTAYCTASGRTGGRAAAQQSPRQLHNTTESIL